MDKLIIEVAVNGGAMRDQNPNVPYSPEEIARDALDAYRAGAAVAHAHARDPQTGQSRLGEPDEAELYGAAFRLIHAESDMIVYPSLDGRGSRPPQERMAFLPELAKDPLTKPEMTSVDMGSLNLEPYDVTHKRWLARGFVYQNTVRDLVEFLEICRACAVKPSLGVHEPGHLRTVLAFLDAGLLEEPLHLRFMFGHDSLPFGLPPTPRGLLAYLDMMPADVRCVWEVYCFRTSNFPLAAAAITLGGHVRVGLEDYHYQEEGYPGNVQLVERAVQLARAIGRDIATAREARQMLELPE